MPGPLDLYEPGFAPPQERGAVLADNPAPVAVDLPLPVIGGALLLLAFVLGFLLGRGRRRRIDSR